RAAQSLGNVELLAAVVATRYYDSAGRVGRAVEETALAGWKKARVLTEYGRQNRTHKKVFNHAVSRVGAEALAVALPALSVTGLAVFGLADAGENHVPGNLHWIERSASHNFEFLPGGERDNIAVLVDGQKVG